MNSLDRPPDRRPSFATLFAGITGFIALGIPLAAYVWESVNQLMAGHLAFSRGLLTIPALAILIGFWTLLARSIHRWDAEGHSGPPQRRLP